MRENRAVGLLELCLQRQSGLVFLNAPQFLSAQQPGLNPASDK